MKILHDRLCSSTTRYENGVPVSCPPTALALQAARAISQLDGINNTNAILIQQMQNRQIELLNIIENYKNATINSGYVPPATESLHDAGEETSNVGV